MGPAAARAAQGSMMAAGPRDLFARVEADLARMTARLEYLGERADLAAVHKLFGNAAIIGMVAIMADVLALARSSGVEPDAAIARLRQLDLNAMVQRRGVNMAKGDFAASFEMAMARKDVGLMLETLGSEPAAALPAIAARMDQLIAAGHGALDASAMAIDAVRPG
jgi:3-hydroxyisobutyrate dehydrogenase-like beta-hydroxyacid dehydrogenase